MKTQSIQTLIPFLIRKNFLNINLSEKITNEKRGINNYIKVNLYIKVKLKHNLENIFHIYHRRKIYCLLNAHIVPTSEQKSLKFSKEKCIQVINTHLQEGNKSDQETQESIHANYNKRNIKIVGYCFASIRLAKNLNVNVWQKPPQYCKVISLQLKKKNNNTQYWHRITSRNWPSYTIGQLHTYVKNL